MSHEDQSLNSGTISNSPARASVPALAGNPGTADFVAQKIAVTGVGLCEPSGPAAVYRPRLNNALEQELYTQARRKTAIEEWRIRSFHLDDFAGQSRSPLINPHLRAQELAFHEALQSAGLLRKIGRKQSRRVGVIYIDFYGNTSSLERELSSRELYYLDVYPTYLLQNHNISGFSMKTRGERNGVMEAFDVAQTLIRSGELDTVVLGGFFPCYSYLFLSEALEDAAWLKDRGWDGRAGVCDLCERSMFLVLEGDSGAAERKQPALFHVGDPDHYRLPAGNLSAFWSARWRGKTQSAETDPAGTNRVNPSTCFGGAYSAVTTDLEFASFTEAYPDAVSVDLSAGGDSGHLNALKPFLRSNVDQALIHTCDRSGSGSELIIDQIKDIPSG